MTVYCPSLLKSHRKHTNLTICVASEIIDIVNTVNHRTSNRQMMGATTFYIAIYIWYFSLFSLSIESCFRPYKKSSQRKQSCQLKGRYIILSRSDWWVTGCGLKAEITLPMEFWSLEVFFYIFQVFYMK